MNKNGGGVNGQSQAERDNRFLGDQSLPDDQRLENSKILSNQQIVEKILTIQKMALDAANFFL